MLLYSACCSWLLRDPNMSVRSAYQGYLNPADAYLAEVFKRISPLQFTKGDGPIIAFQVLKYNSLN